VLFVIQAVVFGHDLALLGQRLLFTAMLIVLFGTDLETQRLPNVITLPGIVIGAACSLALPPGIQASLLGIALGGGVLLAIRWGWKKATGVDGMGLGDVKMLAMVGAFLGWRNVVVVLFLSSIVGAVVGVTVTALKGRSLTERIPFGTFLALAAYVASLAGEQMMAWYLSSFD
jgi:leader peptidase (prepilin peptidase)/N-methyltransferase